MLLVLLVDKLPAIAICLHGRLLPALGSDEVDGLLRAVIRTSADTTAILFTIRVQIMHVFFSRQNVSNFISKIKNGKLNCCILNIY